MSIPKTEMRNPASMHLDRMDTEDMARLVVTANYEAVKAVEEALPAITKAVDAIAEAFERGNRLFYVGAGTSGRLGVLDASECPPTFGVPQEMVTGILAGGRERMFAAGEAEEDRYDYGYAAICDEAVIAGDVVVGLSVAGNASFVVGAMEAARARRCLTVGISSNPDTAVLNACDIPIFTDTGAEVLTGSTRLKAGTAQKIILNTLSTCAMAKTGKVYENMMINLAPSNEKLKKRVIRITSEILACGADEAEAALEENDWSIRRTIDSKKRL
jgi:N-acetylmuramic acid 6-phosphate etherase